MRRLLNYVIKIADIVGAPCTYLAALWLYNVRKAIHKQPLSRIILDHIGLIPIRRHYHEPALFPDDLRFPLSEIRSLPGVDLNIPEQLELLRLFTFQKDLQELPLCQGDSPGFFYQNQLFESGDSEFLFNMIRHFKPVNIVEIGGGYSTLMAEYAIHKNVSQDDKYSCSHTCIEPYERPWLEDSGANVIRSKVELIDRDFFQVLGPNDILFIDSSHVIRPQGDVLFEFLELIGSLRSGVFVHVHDIFTPRDYPEKWVIDYGMLWNEQYLLEAFLSFNENFKVIGSLNHLWHNHRDCLINACPMLTVQINPEPSSFWIVKN